MDAKQQGDWTPSALDGFIWFLVTISRDARSKGGRCPSAVSSAAAAKRPRCPVPTTMIGLRDNEASVWLFTGARDACCYRKRGPQSSMRVLRYFLRDNQRQQRRLSETPRSSSPSPKATSATTKADYTSGSGSCALGYKRDHGESVKWRSLDITDFADARGNMAFLVDFALVQDSRRIQHAESVYLVHLEADEVTKVMKLRKFEKSPRAGQWGGAWGPAAACNERRTQEELVALAVPMCRHVSTISHKIKQVCLHFVRDPVNVQFLLVFASDFHLTRRSDIVSSTQRAKSAQNTLPVTEVPRFASTIEYDIAMKTGHAGTYYDARDVRNTQKLHSARPRRPKSRAVRRPRSTTNTTRGYELLQRLEALTSSDCSSDHFDRFVEFSDSDSEIDNDNEVESDWLRSIILRVASPTIRRGQGTSSLGRNGKNNDSAMPFLAREFGKKWCERLNCSAQDDDSTSSDSSHSECSVKKKWHNKMSSMLNRLHSFTERSFGGASSPTQSLTLAAPHSTRKTKKSKLSAHESAVGVDRRILNHRPLPSTIDDSWPDVDDCALRQRHLDGRSQSVTGTTDTDVKKQLRTQKLRLIRDLPSHSAARNHIMSIAITNCGKKRAPNPLSAYVFGKLQARRVAAHGHHLRYPDAGDSVVQDRMAQAEVARIMDVMPSSEMLLHNAAHMEASAKVDRDIRLQQRGARQGESGNALRGVHWGELLGT